MAVEQSQSQKCGHSLVQTLDLVFPPYILPPWAVLWLK